ncbi:MAG: histidine kinase dimerization/phospho-acceptor domain-containing protein [Longimicrobiales bacterium]
MLSAETQERPPRRGASRRELEAGRLDLIRRIAGDLAHEINNPLHASIINLEVLRKRVARGSADEAGERADVIEAEIRRVHGMIDQLLRLLRPDADTGQPVDPDEVVREIAPLLELRARLVGVTFAYQAQGIAQRVDIDRDALRFALLHLTEPLLEALRVTGGGLEIATDEAPQAVRIRIVARPQAAAVAAWSDAAEPRDRHSGTSLPWDRFDAAVDSAAELVRHSGGQIVRSAPDASSAAELTVLLPGQPETRNPTQESRT